MLSSSGREEAMFTVAGLFPLKPVMLLMPCIQLRQHVIENSGLYCKMHVNQAFKNECVSIA